MQGVWLENNTISYRNDLPLPELKAGEALVQVHLAGICATDMELVRGYYPFTGVLGHEFVGKIVACDQAPQRVGERVVGEINVACGQCRACLSGLKRHCENRTVLGIVGHQGAFSEFLSLPLENLIPVPDSIPDDRAVFTEPLAAALEIQEQIPVSPSAHVLVVGAGRLGQLVAHTLALIGCDLQVVVRHEAQKQLLGSKKIHWILEDQVPESTMDIVVDATGSPEGFALAGRAVRPRGTIVLKSTYKGRAEVDLSAIVVDEITLVGSRCGPFEPALRLLESCRVDPAVMIDSTFPLSHCEAAFQRAVEPGVFKVLFNIRKD